MGESHTLLAPCKRPAASYKALQCLLFIGVDGQNAEGVGKQPFHAFMGREIRHDAAVKAAQHFVARLAAEFLVQLARAGWKPYGEGWRRADCYRSMIPCFFSFVYNVERLRLSSSVMPFSPYTQPEAILKMGLS